MARPLLTTYLLTTPPGHPVVSAMLDGEERAHDRGDACGAICHLDGQAVADRPISGLVTLPGPDCARAIAAGLPRRG
jgi:hypothetical protein